MSKKSSTFAPEMKKKQYICPSTSIMQFNTEHLMAWADASGNGKALYGPRKEPAF